MEYDNICKVLNTAFSANHSLINGDMNKILPLFLRNTVGYVVLNSLRISVVYIMLVR